MVALVKAGKATRATDVPRRSLHFLDTESRIEASVEARRDASQRRQQMNVVEVESSFLVVAAAVRGEDGVSMFRPLKSRADGVLPINSFECAI